MTPADLRAICDFLNVERGTGGQTGLARLLGWHLSTVWRKLNDRSKITYADILVISTVMESDSRLGDRKAGEVGRPDCPKSI